MALGQQLPYRHGRSGAIGNWEVRDMNMNLRGGRLGMDILAPRKERCRSGTRTNTTLRKAQTVRTV